MSQEQWTNQPRSLDYVTTMAEDIPTRPGSPPLRTRTSFSTSPFSSKFAKERAARRGSTDMCFTGMSGSQVEITGVATLCFDEEGTWFQGSIASEDDTQYAIYGTKSKRTADCESPVATEEGEYHNQEGIPVIFDIRVVDCEVGEEYCLKRVHGRNGQICTFTCPSITFTTEKVYRGQKADMIAQLCLGHKMGGSKNQVYRGPIRLQCVPTRRNTHWVM